MLGAFISLWIISVKFVQNGKIQPEVRICCPAFFLPIGFSVIWQFQTHLLLASR